MSTKRDTKYAAKRRAAARRRNRDIGRYIFAYFVVAILVISTVSTVFIAQVGAPTTVTPTATPPTDNPLKALVTQADTKVIDGDFGGAIPLYNAYLAQYPEEAEVHFKLGKAYVDPGNPNPDYVAGLDHLQRAININPVGSFVSEAQSLISQYSAAANATAAALASATLPISGTSSVRSTETITATGTSTGTGKIVPTIPVTATTPITP